MLGRLVPADDRLDARPVVRPRRLVDVRRRRGREVDLAQGRVLEQVQHVGGVAPQLGGVGVAHLAAQLVPGGGLQPPVGRRVAGAQQGGDRLAHGLLDHQALAPELGERQRPQPLERLWGGLAGQQRGEQRLRRAAGHAGGVERAPRRRVQAVQVQPRQRVDDRRDRGVLEREPGPLGVRGRREQQRERVAVREAVDRGRVAGRYARVPEQRLGRGRRALDNEVLILRYVTAQARKNYEYKWQATLRS